MRGHTRARTHRHTNNTHWVGVLWACKRQRTHLYSNIFHEKFQHIWIFPLFLLSHLYGAFFPVVAELLQPGAGGALSWANGHSKSLAVLPTHTHPGRRFFWVFRLVIPLGRTSVFCWHWQHSYDVIGWLPVLAASQTLQVRSQKGCPEPHFFLSHRSEHLDLLWCQLLMPLVVGALHKDRGESDPDAGISISSRRTEAQPVIHTLTRPRTHPASQQRHDQPPWQHPQRFKSLLMSNRWSILALSLRVCRRWRETVTLATAAKVQLFFLSFCAPTAVARTTSLRLRLSLVQWVMMFILFQHGRPRWSAQRTFPSSWCFSIYTPHDFS